MAENIKKDKKSDKICTSIGGQAVMEGVMMRGKKSMAIAVRDSDGCIRLETKRIKQSNSFFSKVPVIRGVFNFLSTMIMGINTLMRSADVYGEAEPTKFENWLSKKFKINLMTVVTVISLFLGVGLAVALFVLLPTFLADTTFKIFNISNNSSPTGYSFLVGGFKIIILICYLLLVSLLKDIKRTFMYHGSEHKTISCYESGKELTVENAQKCSTLHNRCGTTFLFYVVFLSIITFIVVQKIVNISLIDNYFIQIGVRILIIPLVAGLAYELLKFLAKNNWLIFKPLKLPGLALQKITTKQPTDDMVEVAILAFKTVLEMENDDSIPEVKFVTMQKTENVYKEIQALFENAGIEGTADIDWIFIHVLGIKRSEIKETKIIKAKDYEAILALAKLRASGKPLQYVLRETEFYGFKIKLNEDVLIPRFDTELVAEKAISFIKKDDKVLDLCTGSGCIAVTVQKKTGCKMFATDISEKAIELAKKNAALNNADITFMQSNMFEKLSDEKFDCIISNPPYIKTANIQFLDKTVKEYEPLNALDGGIDGLDFYRIIAQEGKKHLNSGGVIVLEIGEGQTEDVKNLFADYADIKVYKDLCNIDRILTIQGDTTADDR